MNDRRYCNDRCYGEPCIHIQPGYRPAKRGLPYGWWKSALFWDTVSLIVLALLGTLIFLAWLYDWKPMW